jgi:hypothetical protein
VIDNGYSILGFMMDISLLGRKDVSARNDIIGANRGPE